MSLEISFKDVCAIVKKQGKGDAALIQAVDNLFGLAIICSPVVLGSAALAFLPTLAVKNELTRIGKAAFEKFTKIKDEDYQSRHEAMHIAYGLLVFTSFFDALDSQLPDGLRKEIAVLTDLQTAIVKEAVSDLHSMQDDLANSEGRDAAVGTYACVFPHPTETLAEQCTRQRRIWKQMAQCFTDVIQRFAFWEEADEKKKADLLAGLEKLDELAAQRFGDQYFELARRFESFAIWANLQEHKGTKSLISELSQYVRNHAQLSAATEKVIDVGFRRLRETVLSIPETLKISQAVDIAESLNKHYQARINESIIEDKEGGDDDKPRLTFPKVCDAFVPQAFKVTRKASSSKRLEDESTWSGLPRRNDLGAFLLSYLSSPYSTEAPLLILGHPGSGKSLLTTVLAAQLMSKHFTAIRVPLREVNADADIVTQIEDSIKRITGVGFDSWIKLSALFKNCPPLIILDGYDELLQATGQVFASYIKDAQRFQERQAEQGRPLRIIITSRVTLIDKAVVPTGSTIVRLLEFDKYQRACWSGIWNSANASYFRDTGVQKFSLPAESERGAEKILNLAEQPLLLLMLALYDSQENQLKSSKGLDRTKLYDSLLRRFVIRERGKESGFNDARAKEREKALLQEMQRLGVAALGMYNRRKVHILSPELDNDLAFFKLEREIAVKSGKALSQADLLLGSFFFVHKSKAQHSGSAEVVHEETAAFEFLHNTFGEFLTADFILRRAVGQAKALRAAQSNDALRSMLDKMMGTADGFERDWFACQVYTPLFTRPVVMEMIREWTPHVLREHDLAEDEFVDALEQIVLNQFKRLLSKREMPQIMTKETAQEGYRVPFGDHPLVGHIAIYSINLILLRLVAGSAPFIFEEAEIVSHEDGTRPWDRLMHIWRSWFSLGNLNGLAAGMLASREGTRVTVTLKGKIQAEEFKSKLQEYFNVARALGDDVSAGISGLHLHDPANELVETLSSLEKKLASEGFDLSLQFAIAKLHECARGMPDSIEALIRTSKYAIEQSMRAGRRDLMEITVYVIERVLRRANAMGLRMSYRGGIFREIFHPKVVVEIAMLYPGAALAVYRLGSRLHDSEWCLEFGRRFMELAMDKAQLFDVAQWNTDWLDWLSLLREVGGRRLMLRWRKGIQPQEFYRRMFDPAYLIEISKRDPEGVLLYLQVLREMGGERDYQEFVGRRLGRRLFEAIFGQNFVDVTERNPDAGFVYLQILRELGGAKYIKRFVDKGVRPNFVAYLAHPERILRLAEFGPEKALSYLEALYELGFSFTSKQLSDGELAKFWERLFRPRYFLDFVERDPERALTYVKIAKHLGGLDHLRHGIAGEQQRDLFSHLFSQHLFVELAERNPNGAFAYLQVLHEIQAFELSPSLNISAELVERIFHSHRSISVDMRDVVSLRLWLAGARTFQSKNFSASLSKVLSTAVRERQDILQSIAQLPISSLADLRWLAEATGNTDLNELIAKLTAH